MLLFEMNVRLLGEPLDRIAEEHLDRLAALGFDWVWLMGLWRIGPAAVAISKLYGADFQGSPYAIASYDVSPELGGDAALRAFVARAHRAGLKVMADFVPNHMSVDSPLIDAHPEFAIHSNPELRHESPHDYFKHPKGRLAHGKDPYFPGWTDTVQLDYAHPGLRAYQTATLARLAEMVDGVRCDMAMLVLREQVKQIWFPRVDQALFDHHYPREFWADAIDAVRARRRDFVFMAEVYWDKDPYLQSLGFDYTYDKKLYDLLSHGRLEDIHGYLSWAPPSYLSRCVHFLENHDEERAAARFVGRSHAAAILSYAIPGAVFIHQGQMEAYREKLPVQRLRPLEHEVPDARERVFHERLIACVKQPIFREGALASLGVQRGVLLVLRRHEDRVVLVGADPGGHQRAASPELVLTREHLGLLGVPLEAALRAVDLWACAPVEVTRGADHLRLGEGAIPSYGENQAFMLELLRG